MSQPGALMELPVVMSSTGNYIQVELLVSVLCNAIIDNL